MEKTIKKRKLGVDTDHSVAIDMKISSSTSPSDLKELVEWYEPTGIGNPAISILFPRMRLCQCKRMGPQLNHLRLLFEFGSYRWPALFWKKADEFEKNVNCGDIVSIVGQLRLNYFRMQKDLRIEIIDYEKHNT